MKLERDLLLMARDLLLLLLLLLLELRSIQPFIPVAFFISFSFEVANPIIQSLHGRSCCCCCLNKIQS
jgi:hypothetical protein